MGAPCGDHLLDYCVHNPLLVWEVISDDALADAGPLGDLVNRGLGKPHFSDRVDRTVDDLRAARGLGERPVLRWNRSAFSTHVLILVRSSYIVKAPLAPGEGYLRPALSAWLAC